MRGTMMEKSALAGEGGGYTPTHFQPITITYKVAVSAPVERADTVHSLYFISTLHLLCGMDYSAASNDPFQLQVNNICTQLTSKLNHLWHGSALGYSCWHYGDSWGKGVGTKLDENKKISASSSDFLLRLHVFRILRLWRSDGKLAI